MRVRYLLLNGFRLSGSVRTVLQQAQAMADAGHQVEVVSAVRDRDGMFFPLPRRVPVRVLVDTREPDPYDIPGVLVPRAEGQYRAFTRRVEDALVAYLRTVRDGILVGTKPGLNVLLARYATAPLIRVGQEHRNLAHRKPELREVIAREYRHLDAVVTLTEADRAAYAAALGTGPVVAAIPNGLPGAGVGHGRRLLPRRPVVVAAGRLSHQKGFDLLIRAFGPVVRQHPRWRLRIIGRGRQEAALRDQIARYGLEGRVHLPGATRRLERQLAAASLFVLSSRFEGFPLVLLEAMACGLPVVSFDCRYGPAEVIRTPEEGILVPPEDVPGLTAAISRLVADPARRREMGAAARARAGEFTTSRTVPMWEGLFRDLQRRRAAVAEDAVADPGGGHYCGSSWTLGTGK